MQTSESATYIVFFLNITVFQCGHPLPEQNAGVCWDCFCPIYYALLPLHLYDSFKIILRKLQVTLSDEISFLGNFRLDLRLNVHRVRICRTFLFSSEHRRWTSEFLQDRQMEAQSLVHTTILKTFSGMENEIFENNLDDLKQYSTQLHCSGGTVLVRCWCRLRSKY